MSPLIQTEAPELVAADGFGSVCGWRSPKHLLCPPCEAGSALAPVLKGRADRLGQKGSSQCKIHPAILGLSSDASCLLNL